MEADVLFVAPDRGAVHPKDAVGVVDVGSGAAVEELTRA